MFKLLGGREGINKCISFFMNKNNENKTFLGKINNIVLSSSVPYNADKTSFSYYFLCNMCNTTMGTSVQVRYIKW